MTVVHPLLPCPAPSHALTILRSTAYTLVVVVLSPSTLCRGTMRALVVALCVAHDLAILLLEDVRFQFPILLNIPVKANNTHIVIGSEF